MPTNERLAPRRWLIGLAGLLLVLLTAGVYSLFSLSNASRRTEHTDQVRLEAARLLRTATDAETGARGYIVAGEPGFLDIYTTAIAEWKPRLDALRALTRNNPAQQARLDRLEQLVGRRLDLLQNLRARFDAGDRGAQLTPLMLDGKRAMDAAREIFGEMESEAVRLDEARRTTETNRWRITFLLLAAGVIAFVVMLALAFVQRRDAEARRLHSEELARANELFKIVIEGAAMGITVLDRKGALVYANAAGANMVGFPTAEALLAAPLSELMVRFKLVDDNGVAIPIERLPSREALRGATPDEMLVRFRAHGSRDERRSLLRSVPARDAAGEVSYVINFFREVTEKARRDEQRAFLLRAVDELNSSLDHEHTLATVTRMAVPGLADWCAVDLVVDGRLKRVAVAHVDPAKITFIDELVRRYPADPNAVTGVPQIVRTGKAEFIADLPHELIRAAAIDDEHLTLIDSLQLHSYIGVPLTVRGTTIGAMTFAMAESERRYTALDLEFAEGLADRAALAIENARLFHELEKANTATKVLLESETKRRSDAESTSRFADMFIGILGHDLRNPLNAVLMAAQLMRRRPGTDLKTLERIEASSRRMSEMVTQLLDLARSRLGEGIDIAPIPCELGAIARSVVDELRLIYPSREIVVEQHEVQGTWDAARLGQAISNLVGNALEHGDPSKPVTLQLARHGDDVELCVHNEGERIPPELLPHLFDPYRRVTARGPRSKGLGLGLFITQQIVVAHGGHLDVRSDDTGTRFIVVLPHRANARGTVEEQPGSAVHE